MATMTKGVAREYFVGMPTTVLGGYSVSEVVAGIDASVARIAELVGSGR